MKISLRALTFVLMMFACDVQAAAQDIIDELNQELVGSYLESATKDKCLLSSAQDCLYQGNGYWEVFLQGRGHCYPSTVCGYYKCMEEKYQCEKHGVDYFTKLAYPTCSQYVSNIKKGMFSPEGIKWIYSVMVCLQKGLFNECELEGNCHDKGSEKSCRHIVEFTLKFHPGCYINSGPGICNLPVRDQISIWRTVAPYLTKREKKEAAKVMRHCVFGKQYQ